MLPAMNALLVSRSSPVAPPVQQLPVDPISPATDVHSTLNRAMMNMRLEQQRLQGEAAFRIQQELVARKKERLPELVDRIKHLKGLLLQWKGIEIYLESFNQLSAAVQAVDSLTHQINSLHDHKVCETTHD